jgi:hypothetical protein
MPLAETAAGRDDRLSGTYGRESLAASDVRGINRQIGESQPLESFAFPTDDLKLIAMLVKEKRRATWSLAIGALISIAYFGWCYLASWRIDNRIQGLVGQCEQRDIRQRQKFKSYDDFEKDLRGSDEFKKLTSSDQDKMLGIARHPSER